MNAENTYDVIVVGAGVVGCSIAYHLTAAGLKTALLEQRHVGAGASGANFGMVQTNDVELKHSIPLVTASFARFETLEEELGMPLEFRHIGALRLLTSEAQLREAQERLRVLPAAGIPYEFVPAERVQEIEPFVPAGRLFGALYSSRQGQINPFLLMWGYLRRALAQGLALHTFCEVSGFEVAGGRLRGVQTSRGSFSAGQVVLATAAWTRRLGGLLGRDWAIHTFRASAMITEAANHLHLRTILTAADVIELPIAGSEDSELTTLALRQTPEGHLLIAQADRNGESLSSEVSHVAPKAIARLAQQHFPALSPVHVRRAWTAPTTFVADGCPFLGRVEHVEGLILATAFRSALVNAPIAGEIVRDLVLHGHCEKIDIRPFSPQRRIEQPRDGRMSYSAIQERDQ